MQFGSVGVRMWFVPVKRGPYEMHVTLYGEPVPDSPLKFQIDVPIVPPIILIKVGTREKFFPKSVVSGEMQKSF